MTKERTALEDTMHDLELKAAGAVGQNVKVCDGCGSHWEWPNNEMFQNNLFRVENCEHCVK